MCRKILPDGVTGIKYMIELFNKDCMKLMARYPNKFFHLAIVDPPYGIGSHKEQGLGDSRTGNRKQSKWAGHEWDHAIPDKAYFKELFRVSKNQVIWGGNYFDLSPTPCVFVWDKVQRIDQADCEIAWTSFKTPARIFEFSRSVLQGFQNPNRFHPTEKPVKLYEWILVNYSNPKELILDTHVGSGSLALACHNLGFDMVGSEIDAEYYEAAKNRLEQHQKQGKLFVSV